MNSYIVAYTINYKNGTWTGPHKATIDGRTMASAWEVYRLSIMAWDISYVSIIQWQTVPRIRREER